MKDIEPIAAAAVDISLRIHRDLGPGLLESVYETVLAGRLASLGYSVARQRPIDIMFDGLRFDAAFKADIVVEECLVIEIKSVERLNPAHAKQLLTYLRLMKQPLGLLINFGGETLKGELRRIANGYVPLAPSRLRVNQIDGE